MSLTVLQVAYPLAPVGIDAVGGAEQVLSHLDRALVAAGHRSLVIACAGSKVAGTLIETPASAGRIDEEARAQAQAAHRRAIEAALARWPVDVVHLHGLDFDAYLPPPGPPVLVTLHLPPDWYAEGALRPGRPRTWLHCVSAAQARACPSDAPLLPVIENGVPIEAFAAPHAKRDFALSLGRICPEKGFHLALDAARQAGMPLLLAGRVFPYPAHEDYFMREILPRLDPKRRFLGPLGLARKRRLLGAARCLVQPSLAAETSSLVAMEALAAGTPVVAHPAGALAEIVEHGRTGFLVGDVAQMAEAMRAASHLDPARCRETARARFALERMAGQYLDRYRRLAAHARAA
jgi:glycosyltransferase involved in cell wall biosynthesis